VEVPELGAGAEYRDHRLDGPGLSRYIGDCPGGYKPAKKAGMKLTTFEIEAESLC
jgi:hypothetical protein